MSRYVVIAKHGYRMYASVRAPMRRPYAQVMR